MAITFVDKTTNAGIGATNLVLNVPPVFADDELIAFLQVANTSAVITPPAGWSLVASVTVGGSGGKLYAYRRRAGGSEPGSYTWTSDLATAWGGEMSCRRGVPAATGLWASVTSTNVTTTAHSTGTLDALKDAWLVAAFGDDNNALAFTSTSGMTSRSDVTWFGGRLGTFDEPVPAATQAGPETASTTSAANSATIMIALGGVRPPVAGANLSLSGRVLTLEDTSSDPDGDLSTVTVDWGDGTAPQGITPASTVTHTYPYATATYTVQVTAVDTQALQNTWQSNVNVVDAIGSIAASHDARYSYRVLTVDLNWPDDGAPANDAPFATPGQRVTVPAISEPVPAYDAATFNAAVWTDCTALVSGYPSYSQSLDLASDRLTLRVATAWANTALRTVFREMRAILVQERWQGGVYDTGWFSVAWCLSDGFSEVWERGGRHVMQVTARDALKLFGLHRLGRETGSEVYQPDLVQAGTVASHQALTWSREMADAWEFGLPSRVTGNPHPNWASQPAPQLWCHNVPTAAIPVRLEMAGEAVQFVPGEGLVRVSKSYAAASPGPAAEEDYSVGLGITGQPDIRGVVYRYAHPAMDGADGAVDTDLIPSLVVAGSGAGYVDVAGDYSTWPAGLTLYAADGTGDEWHVSSLVYSAPNTRLTLVEAGVTVTVGRALSYGWSNAVTEVIRRLALRCGYQVEDAEDALAIAASNPIVLGAAEPIVLPPQTYADTDRRTPMEALETLRREGYVPPNYLPIADAEGRVAVESVEQLATGHADIIPLAALMAPAAIRRTDREVYTDVVARGLVRQASNAAGLAGVSVALTAGASGLPAPAYTLYGSQSPNAARLAAMLAPEGSAGGRHVLSAVKRRLIGWALHPIDNATDAAKRDALWAQWCGAGMVDVTLAGAVQVYAIDLDISNPWVYIWQQGSPQGITDNAGWRNDVAVYGLPEAKHVYRPARLDLQALSIQYLDPDTASWRPLVSSARGKYQFPDKLRLEAEQFDTRAPTTMQQLRITCLEPAVALVGSYDDDPNWYYAQWSFFLSALRVWGSTEIRSTAVLGQTAPFNTAAWRTVRKRLRPRTWVMPDAVPWASSQAKADDLSLLWLKEFARDLAPRQLSAYRPDVRAGNTVRATLPGGSARDYLVIGTERRKPGVVDVTAVDYGSPYEEW